MAKAKKLADPSLKVVHHPLAQTLAIYTSAYDTIKTVFPTLDSALSDLIKYNEPKLQKQALKTISSSDISKNQICYSALTKLLIACYLDFAFAPLKAPIAQLLTTLSDSCIGFLKSPGNRNCLLFDSNIPLSHTEYLFSRYIELMQKCALEIAREECSKILALIVSKIETERQQQKKDKIYNVSSMNSTAICLTFLSTFIPKWIPEMNECDQIPLKTLADCACELTKEQLVDRDILTLAGINYWLAAISLIRKQIGDYAEETECEYLNTMLSKGRLNLEDIKKEELVKQLDILEETPNVLCIIRGFIRIIKNLVNLYKPYIGKDCSYMDYILQCCENDQINTKAYGLVTLNSILIKKDGVLEVTKKEFWAKRMLSIVLTCLDFPHKGTVKVAEDCYKSLLMVINKNSISMIDTALPLIKAIPNNFRKRKLLALTPLIEFLRPEDLKHIKCYIKYSLECILEDTSTIRMASICVTAILSKLKGGNTRDWLTNWCDDFISTLSASKDKITVLSNSMINVILDIDHNALPLLVSRVLESLSKIYSTELLIVLLALLIEARRLRKLKFEEKKLILADEVVIELNSRLINALFSLADSNVSLLSLTLCISNPKVSEPPELLDRLLFAKAIQVHTTNTYDDYKEKHMKLCQKYLIDLKAKYHQSSIKDKEMKELRKDLEQIVEIAGRKLRVDAGYEMVCKPLAVLKTVWSALGEEARKWKLHSHLLGLFAVNGLSSTWDLERKGLYAILEEYPIDALSMKEWQDFGKCALKGLCSPRATEAEGAALFLKLLYSKLLETKDFELEWNGKSKTYAETLSLETELTRKQLRWIKIILQRIKTKRETINETLFKKASCEDLFHGELRFLHLALQCMQIEQSETSNKEWKVIVEEILKVLQEVSDYCESLLSSAGIIDEETGNIIIDCRGRLSQLNPEIKAEIAKAEVESEFCYAEDYENLLSTGIWLIAKESGNLYKMLSEWLIIPGFNKASWFTDKELKTIALNLLGKILSYKHRGAFLKLVEGLEMLMSKCLRSNIKELQVFPEYVLEAVFKQIEEGVLEANKTLRRSAGVPHSIIAVLRSEAYPILLGKTIGWLLERAKRFEQAEICVHSLNILRLIFEDGEIRQKIQPFVYDVLMVATEGLSDPQWKVRNSSLMIFTAATKRIFGASSTLEEHLNKQGKTIYEFFGQTERLCKFMLEKLKENSPRNDPNSKFAIFPILLLFSRLLPLSQNKTIDHVSQYIPLFKSEILKLLGHADIGIRKISSKALLSLINPDSHFDESIKCLKSIKAAGSVKAKLKPNLIHGLLELVFQLLKSQFKDLGERYDLLIKAFIDICFILEWEQSLITASFYKLLNKLISKGRDRDSIEVFKKQAMKTCLSKGLVNLMEGFDNSIREQITFISKYEAIYNPTSFTDMFKIIEKYIESKEWANIAWSYRAICKATEKFSLKLKPNMKHITLLANKNLDATKYCLKFITKQLDHIDFDEIKSLWPIFKDLKVIYRGVEHKIMLRLGCKLIKYSLKHEVSQWLNKEVNSLLIDILSILYESQYNEDMHPIRVIAAIEFENLVALLNPEIIVKNGFNVDLIFLQTFALRVMVQLLHSDNVEIRDYTAREISRLMEMEVEILTKDSNGEMLIKMKNAEFNEAFTFTFLFEYLRDAVVKNGNKEWTSKFISILWEMVTNLYFLENERKNEGKNLVFIYEPLNGYINNIQIKLFALKLLISIPDYKDYLIKTEGDKFLTEEEAVKELCYIRHQPNGLIKLAYIKFVDKLIHTYIEDYILTDNKSNVKKILIALKETKLMDTEIIETFLNLLP